MSVKAERRERKEDRSISDRTFCGDVTLRLNERPGDDPLPLWKLWREGRVGMLNQGIGMREMHKVHKFSIGYDVNMFYTM